MTPTPLLEVDAPSPGCAVTHGTTDVEFVDLLVADPEWVAREFDEIVAAGWGAAEPPRPAERQGAHRPRRPGLAVRPTPVARPSGTHDGDPATAHQRGPPGWRWAVGPSTPA